MINKVILMELAWILTVQGAFLEQQSLLFDGID
jgi:hypothetical protein